MTMSISRKFTIPQLLAFAMPSTIMMVCMSLYTIVDGLFISNFAGTDALTASNIVFPIMCLFVASGVMFATGGAAVVATQIGEGQMGKAKRNLSLITLTSFLFSVVAAALILIFLDPVLRFLGATEALMPLCVSYIRIILLFAPAMSLQILFQSLLVVAGKPGLGLALTIGAGVVNIILDGLFMGVMDMGIAGAAWGTVVGYLIPALVGLVFFFSNRKGLAFDRPTMLWRTIGKTMSNGSSEMVSNVSTSVTTLLFNLYMLRLVGPDGVAALTIVMYSQFFLSSVFMGFSMGVAPVLSFRYGSNDIPYLKHLIRICINTILVASVSVVAISYLGRDFLVSLFVPESSPVHALAVHGFTIYTITYLFVGYNMFSSAEYTALSDGKTSAIISFSRTFLFLVSGIIGLTALWGLEGLWLAVPVAEAVTTIMIVIMNPRWKRKLFSSHTIPV